MDIVVYFVCRWNVCTGFSSPFCNGDQWQVTVRCACQRLKKEWLCRDVQKEQISGKSSRKEGLRSGLFIGLIPCDQECSRLVAVKEAEYEAELLRQRKGKEREVWTCRTLSFNLDDIEHRSQTRSNSNCAKLPWTLIYLLNTTILYNCWKGSPFQVDNNLVYLIVLYWVWTLSHRYLYMQTNMQEVLFAFEQQVLEALPNTTRKKKNRQQGHSQERNNRLQVFILFW